MVANDSSIDNGTDSRWWSSSPPRWNCDSVVTAWSSATREMAASGGLTRSETQRWGDWFLMQAAEEAPNMVVAVENSR